MALKGNLKDFSLTQLLNLVRLAHKTGCLNVDQGGGPLHIYCEDGRLTSVIAGGRGSILADGLVRAGRVTDDQIKLVRPRLIINTDKELALQLIEAGFVSREEVMEVVQKQTLEALFPAFTWSRGTFTFDTAARPMDDSIALSMELEAVILEGGRRIRETGRLEQAIPSLDIVPRLSPQRDTKMRNINLSVDQWKMISFINGRNSLRQIADYSGLNEFQARKVMQELVNANLAEIAELQGKGKAARGGMPKPAPGGKPVNRNIIMRLIDRVRRL